MLLFGAVALNHDARKGFNQHVLLVLVPIRLRRSPASRLRNYSSEAKSLSTSKPSSPLRMSSQGVLSVPLLREQQEMD